MIRGCHTAAAQTTRALPGANTTTTTTTTSTHNNDANVFCDAILCTENDEFTKTGSGQTQRETT